MKLFLKNRICLIILLYLLVLLLKRKNYLYTSLNNDSYMSIVINIKNLSKEIHTFYIDFIKKMNTTRNFYFIKSNKKSFIDI